MKVATVDDLFLLGDDDGIIIGGVCLDRNRSECVIQGLFDRGQDLGCTTDGVDILDIDVGFKDSLIQVMVFPYLPVQISLCRTLVVPLQRLRMISVVAI